jgi:predicted nucleic acid-binding protein
MRRTVFLDTSYPIALVRNKDDRHMDEVEAATKYTGPFLTTDLVLVELANALSPPPFRSTVVNGPGTIRHGD